MFLKKYKKPVLEYFSVDIASHCNLNCKYCDHFSPLADEQYVNINDLKKHFKQISKLVYVNKISLMGGEPLLHPNITDIMIMAKDIFPNTNIILWTNGILLEHQPDKFWEICKQYKISIEITKYPIQLNYKLIKEKMFKYNILFSYVFERKTLYKKMHKFIFDLEGKQNPEEMSKICWQNKGHCTYFNGGYFYPCSIAGNVWKFNKYFGKNLIVSKDDCVNIYKVKNGDEIIKFINEPVPFCRYCDIKNQVIDLDFEISQRDISEWI